MRGKFVLFKEKEGILRMKGDDGKEFDGIKVAEGTPVVSVIDGKEIKGTAPEALRRWDGGDITVLINDGKATHIAIGIKKVTDKTPDLVPENSEGKQIELRPRPESDRVPEKAADKVGQKRRMEWGKLVSFQDGVLRLKNKSGNVIEHKIPENAKASVWNNSTDTYQPKGAAEAFREAKEGTWIYVSDGAKPIYIGTRKGQSVGTFVSFKDDRLLLLGKNLGESFTKKYGNNLHFNKFADNVPVYESIDGGEYKLIGTANKSLGNVKEGTLVTVYAEGDDNITFIQIGVPKQQ